jgi:hypothetical protein
MLIGAAGKVVVSISTELPLTRLTSNAHIGVSVVRMTESMSEFELAFEQEAALERRRRQQLRQRAAARSRAKRIAGQQQRGRVAFGVLVLALTATVVVVVVAMFETLAWVMG